MVCFSLLTLLFLFSRFIQETSLLSDTSGVVDPEMLHEIRQTSYRVVCYPERCPLFQLALHILNVDSMTTCQDAIMYLLSLLLYMSGSKTVLPDHYQCGWQADLRTVQSDAFLLQEIGALPRPPLRP